MKGDFSTWRYDPLDNYHGVLFQQGRVTLDADLTESELIDIDWRSQAARDAIGAGVAAVPAAEPDGFRIARARVDGAAVKLDVMPGRVWADGLLLRLPADPASPGAALERIATYFPPPINPAGTGPAGIGGGVRDAVVLELALEELNGFQAPARLIEPALGGPDTAERVAVRHGFRLVRLSAGEDCHGILERIADGPAGKGRLTARLEPPEAIGTECPVVAGGGYTGFEHNLYRVEIAHVNAGGPRFKWSQFNAGLVGRGEFHAPSGSTPARVVITANRAAIVNSGLTQFYLEALVRDAALGHWVVRYGATASLNTQSDLELTPVYGSFPSPAPPETTIFFRLWNGLRDVSEFAGNTPAKELRDGILLDFDPPGGASYRPGDYWVFPVRAGEIANPEVLIDAEPPAGPVYRRVPLAEIHWSADRDTAVSGAIEDCRRRFRPLTNQKICCSLLVGDGVSSFGDFNSLEEAASHLPESGGELCLLPGVHFANLTLENRRDVRIHGCPRRTLLMPRPEAPGQPILRIQDCTGIGVAHLDLFAFEGTAVVAAGSVPGALRDLRVHDCRMLARDYGIRVERGEDVAIARNLIWILDTDAGRAAIELRAKDALVERNATGVWPFEQKPPGDDGPQDEGENPNPASPCVEPENLYGNLTWVLVYVNFIWVNGVQSAPAQPYKAWGGIHLRGACENVRLLENRIDGGIGHGVTLGGVLPGPSDAPAPQDAAAAAPTVTLSDRSFFAYVRDESGSALPGIDVFLSRNGTVAHSATSAGVDAALDIAGIPALTYAVSVEPGYELASISEGEFEGSQFFTLTVRPAAVDIPEDRGFLYRILIQENEIQRMGLSGIGFRPFGEERAAIPSPKLDDLESVVAFGNALLAPRELLASCNLVRDLEIRGNRIHHNLRAVFDDALRRAARSVGQGGISLALAESAVIAGNHIHDNGVSAATPVCGIFIGYGEDLSISDNRITANGAVLENYREQRIDGLRGGVFVRFASAFLIGGESDAFQKPALRICDNRIDQPAGRAVTAIAFGPVSCSDNYFNSEHDGRWSFIDTLAGGVLILNLGGIHRQLTFGGKGGLLAASNAGGTAVATGTGTTNLELLGNRAMAVRTNVSAINHAGFQVNPFGDTRLAEILLPGGETLYNSNQVRIGPGNQSFLTQLLVTLDDLGYDGNQSSAFRQDLMFGNTVCVAHTLRATDNRFRERTAQCFFSLLTYAFGLTDLARLMTMNTTVHNQGDHCIFALSNAPGAGLPVIRDQNLVLFRSICPSSNERAGVIRYLAVGLIATIYAQHQASLENLDPAEAATTGLSGSLGAVQQFNSANYYVQRQELKRIETTHGASDLRVQEGNQRLARYAESNVQVGAQAELATVNETQAPDNGFLLDGRVADERLRGRENARVELVRADGTSLGITATTGSAGYFAMPLDQGQAAKLQAEKDVRLKVSDAKGRELYRSEQPVAVKAGEPVRANIVLARREVPQSTRARATVIFGGIARVPLESDGSTPLESIKGIGPKTAEKLRAAGIADVETFLRTPGDKLVAIAGFDAEVMRREAEKAIKERGEPNVAPGREPATPAPDKPSAARGEAKRGKPKKR